MAEMSVRDKILAVRELYTLPQTLIEILRVTDSPQTSAFDLSRIILRDGPITARLLKMANSAFYGQAGQVNTVQQAVVLLGFRAVKSLVLSTSVYDVFSPGKTKSIFDLNRFWQHSLETAGIAQLLAGRIGYQPQEEAFVGGLLHDLGLIVMEHALGDDYRRLVSSAPEGVDWNQVEMERFGVDHATAAAWLFESWGLPEQLVQAVGRHHNLPLDGSNEPRDRLTLLVALADRVGHYGVEPRTALTRSQIEEKRRILDVLGLRDFDLAMVDRWMSENLAAVAGHLDIPVGSPLDILVRANQRLSELYQETENLLLASPGLSRDELAREILAAICATFSHHINNAATTIMGHAELVAMAVRRGLFPDPDARITDSMRMIENSVVTISAVLTEMKQLQKFDVVPYHDRVQILDIDEKVKRRVERTRIAK